MPSRGPSPRARSNTPCVTLKTLRQAQGLTQTEVAARLRVSDTVLARYESGARDVPARIAAQFAAAYGIEPGDIRWGHPDDLDEDDEPSPMRVPA